MSLIVHAIQIRTCCSVYRLFCFYRISVQGKGNTNFKDNEGLTPLHLACHEAYFDMAKLLIQNGQYAIE
jgi:ankyrin repeat protein